MTPINPIPPHRFDAELVLVRRLVARPPWERRATDDQNGSGPATDRGIRAAFKRWSPADDVPSFEMMAALWPRVPENPAGLNQDEVLTAVQHAAFILHLQSLSPDEGVPVSNFGEACYRAKVAEGRFARLVNTPYPARLEALGRAFRRFRAENVRLRLVADDPKNYSTRDTLGHLDRDELAALLAFLFTPEPRKTVARWAAGYYHTETKTENVESTEA